MPFITSDTAGKPSSRIMAIRESTSATTIMLVGASGAGKSSLINSLINVVDSCDESETQVQNRGVPTAPPDLQGGHTMMREPIELTKNITIVDNRGWPDWESEVALNELYAQINGERSFTDGVDWETGGKVYMQSSGTPMVVEEKITSLAVVINGVGGIDALKAFKKLIQTCRSGTGRIPTVVITHSDKMSEDEQKTIQTTLETGYGVGKERVFIIHNMTGDDKCVDDSSKSRLFDLLDRCIADGKEGAKFHEKKEKLKRRVQENQKEIDEQEKRESEEADKKEVDEANRLLLLKKANHGIELLQIEKSKAVSFAEIEEGMKKDERKSEQNKHKIEEELKKEELHVQNELNKLKLTEEKKARDRANEQHELAFKRQQALAKIEEEKKREETRHETAMHRQREEKWMELQKSAQQLQLDAVKHANEVDIREKAKFMEKITGAGLGLP